MSKAYTFDIEANGYNEFVIDKSKVQHKEATVVHLLVLRDTRTGEKKVYRNNDEMNTLLEGWHELMSADVIIGHNVIGYDLPVLRRLVAPKGHRQEDEPTVFDTLVAARLLWPDAKFHPFGGNSLEDFGKLLGIHKMKYEGGFDEWTQTMETYCIQDTEVGDAIRVYLIPRLKPVAAAFRIETRVAQIIARQQNNGVRINEKEATRLIEFMELEMAKADDILQKAFPPIVEELKTPQYWTITVEDQEFKAETKKELSAVLKANNFKQSLVKNAVAGPLRFNLHPFNPGSTDQIAARLKEKYGYKAPTTDLGNPSITEEELQSLDYPEAKHIHRWSMADKRLQHLTDWVTRARNCRTPGVIHPQINSCGANTSRMTHQQPNQTACPKVVSGKKADGTKGPLTGFEGRYGWECRSLWGPTRKGWGQVGADASGLELRMLGNRMWKFDGGAYAKEVVSGDVHTLNMKAGDLDTREQSKTDVYAFLYGSGDEGLGYQIADHPSLSPEQRKKYKGRSKAEIGATFRKKMMANLPALKKLIDFCRQMAKSQGFITLLDGRKAPIRSDHSALNTLLQGDGAIVMKLALIILESKLLKAGWNWDVDFAFMLNAHDEFQLECRMEITEDVAKMAVESIREAGVRLKVKCPLDGEAKIGKNWAETH